MTDDEIKALEKKCQKEVDDAAEFALSSPFPPIEELYNDVYVE